MKQKLLVTVLLTALGSSAMSAEIGDWVRFSGFGTLGTAQNNDEQGDYRANIEQSTGVGRTHKHDSGLDSVIAGQADLQFTSQLTGTAQIISRRLSDYNSSRPYFEWANLKYDIDEHAYVRVGRFVAPTFMLSESRMVGYTQLTTRPVAEVYLLSPISYMNGVDGGYKFAVGSSFIKTRAGFGSLNQRINQVNGTLDFKFGIASFDASLEHDGSTFRLGYQRIKMDVKNDALDLYDMALDTLVNNNVANASGVRDNMKHKDVPLDFIDIGYMYDKGSVVVQSEYVIRKFHSDFVQSLSGFYLLGGYRLGQWTPYASFSKLMHKSAVNIAPLDTSSIGGLGGLVNAVNAGSEMRILRDAWTLGVRWDLKENLALKAQIDRVIKPKNTNAEFVNTTNDFFSSERKINVFSATLDFMF